MIWKTELQGRSRNSQSFFQIDCHSCWENSQWENVQMYRSGRHIRVLFFWLCHLYSILQYSISKIYSFYAGSIRDGGGGGGDDVDYDDGVHDDYDNNRIICSVLVLVYNIFKFEEIGFFWCFKIFCSSLESLAQVIFILAISGFPRT